MSPTETEMIVIDYKLIYLDNASTTRVREDTSELVRKAMTEFFGNPGSQHTLGRVANKYVEQSRESVSKIFKCRPEHVIFTSCGSEGNSYVLQTLSERLRRENRKHIILSSVEHDSVVRAAESLLKSGFHITFLPVNSYGVVEIKDLVSSIREDTGLVSIMCVNNETGSVNPINEIGKICKKNNIYFMTDCVQAAGFTDIDVDNMCCDFATISGHKIGAPKGIGALYVRDLSICSSLIYGGENQEFGHRGGTENVPGIIGLSDAVHKSLCDMEHDRETSLKFRDYIIEYLEHNLRGEYKINGYGSGYCSKIINITFYGVDSETLVLMLSRSYDICVSNGSACRSKELSPSRTLKAMGLSDEDARDSIRISFNCNENSFDDIKYAIQKIVDSVNILKGKI